MFGIGSTELLVILVVALIVLGPEKLPQIAKTVGRAMGEFRKVSTDFQRTLNTEIAFSEQNDRLKKAEELEKAEEAAKTEDTQSVASTEAVQNATPEASQTVETAQTEGQT
jgi:sec-independent protein translocase protein TatB